MTYVLHVVVIVRHPTDATIKLLLRSQNQWRI
ncbi:hypothetical protein LINGRAHAP2_LOCUS23828 [Linum grandiflorum]